jgi:hypothetical protein
MDNDAPRPTQIVYVLCDGSVFALAALADHYLFSLLSGSWNGCRYLNEFLARNLDSASDGQASWTRARPFEFEDEETLLPRLD